MFKHIFIFFAIFMSQAWANSPIIGGPDGPTFIAPAIMKDVTTPSNPASGYHKLYFNSVNGQLYQINSSGTSAPVGFANPMTTDGDMIYQSTVPTALAIGSSDTVLISTGSAPSWAKILNANIDSAAAITYGKLSLTGGIVNADINSSAAIGYGKLNLTGSVINADIGPAAAIDYAKLNLTGLIVNADIGASAAIVDTKLATIASTGKVSNSATTATSSNTNSAIVTRDGSGNFSAGTITAALTGNSSTATALASNPTDCGSNTYATTIDASGNLTCASITNASTTGTSSNTISTLVLRDGSGNFSAGTITAALTGAVTGNASTATALASNPTDCGSNTYATTIDANGNLTCASVTNASTTGTSSNTISTLVLRDGSGNFSAGTITAALTGAVTGNASTATALAANPTDCSATQYATTIAANGNLTCAQPSFTDLLSFATLAQGGTNNSGLAATAGGTLYTDGSKVVNIGAGTNGQVLTSTGSTAPIWKASTGGLISEREFSTNTALDVDATGYNSYADAAGIKPVDGTGGSPNTTCARSTSAPITGAGSLLMTKAGSTNRQGEGCSYDFDVDSGAASGSIALGFDYNVTSGTFTAGTVAADSDVEIFIYDKTNGALVSLSDYKLYTSSATPTHFVQTFRGTGALHYRAIFHIPTTTTNNFTWQADNISQFPSSSLLISPVSDWVDFPTVTSGGTAASPGTNFISGVTTAPTLGTTSINKAQWRRVGGDMEVRWDYVSSTGGAAGSGLYVINLPPGYQIDTGKVAVNSGANVYQNGPTLGTFAFADSSTGINGAVTAYSTTQLRADGGGSGGSTGYFQWSSSGNAFGNAAQMFSVHAMFPIAGWTASQTSVRADQSNFPWTDGGANTISSTGGGVVKGTMGRDKVWYRRSGQNLQVRIEFDMTGAGTAGTGDYLFLIPGSYSADTSLAAVFTSSSIQHDPSNLGGAIISNTTPTPVSGFVSLYDATHVRIAITDAGNHFASATYYALGTANQSYAAEYSVPIAGWIENQNAPMLVGTVFSGTGGQERIERINISCAASSTINSQSSAWGTSISNYSGGNCTITAAAGLWSSAPTCVGNFTDTSIHSGQSITVGATSTTSISANCSTSGGACGTGWAANIICMGPR